jgi:hypothetical protein
MAPQDKKFTFFQYYNSIAITVLIFFAGLAWYDAAAAKAKINEQAVELARQKVTIEQNTCDIIKLDLEDKDIKN